MPIDWDLITRPAVTSEHAMRNRLNAEQIAMVLPVIVEQYPFYAQASRPPRRPDA